MIGAIVRRYLRWRCVRQCNRVLGSGTVREIAELRAAYADVGLSAVVDAIDEITGPDVPAYVLRRDSTPWRRRIR